MTRTRAPAGVSTQRPISPLVDLVGFSTTVPVRPTSLASVASSGPCEPRAIGAGKDGGLRPARDPIGGRPDLELAVRVGQPPANLDAGAAMRGRHAVGQLDDDPTARVGDREQRRAFRGDLLPR